MPKNKCKICGTAFYVKPSHAKLGYGKYCSKKCAGQGLRRGENVACHTCGAKTWKMHKDIARSKSNKFFCNKSCQAKWRNKEFSGINHPNWCGGEFTYYRVMRENNIKPVCRDCGYENKKALVIHHKDQNRRNNDISNLTWLCRNCHYLVHLKKTKLEITKSPGGCLWCSG